MDTTLYSARVETRSLLDNSSLDCGSLSEVKLEANLSRELGRNLNESKNLSSRLIGIVFSSFLWKYSPTLSDLDIGDIFFSSLWDNIQFSRALTQFSNK